MFFEKENLAFENLPDYNIYEARLVYVCIIHMCLV